MRYYRRYGKVLSYSKMSAHLTKLKKLEKYQHWNIPYAWSLQNVVKRLAQSFREMQTHGRGHPKFKSCKKHKGMTFDGLHAPVEKVLDKQKNARNHATYHIRLNGRWYRFALHRELKGQITQVQVTRDALGDVYITLTEDYSEVQPEPKTGQAEGFDMGIKDFLTGSDGFNEAFGLFRRVQLKIMEHLNACLRVTLYILFALLTLALLPISSEAEIYNYNNGDQIVTIKGLHLDASSFDPTANRYIPHNGGNDFIIMEQFDKNCGPNSVQMLLYYHRKHRRLKDIWEAAGIRTVAYGTSPPDLRKALNESGVSAHWYTNRTLDDVRRYIRNNRPSILLLRLSNTGYHWVVAVGYDTRQNEILIADPNGRFEWWDAEQLNANWTLEWIPEFEIGSGEWYEFQIDAGLFNRFHLNPNTAIVPLEAPSFETSYLDYWSDMQVIEVYGKTQFRGGTRAWEDTLTFQNPFSIVQVSDIELLTSTGTASVDGWERVNDLSIRVWGEIEDGWFLRGRLWVIVRTFYFNDVDSPSERSTAKAPSVQPAETSVLPNYPNPFNPETWIPYELAKSADVSVSIHSADGKLVRTLALGHKPAGIYADKSRAVYWDGKNSQGEPVASGIYFYTFTAGNFTATRKMLMLK